MPAHIVDGRRTIIQPVGKRRNLVKRPAFSNFFKCPVNVSNRLGGAYNAFTIQFQDILKNAMRSRMRRSEVQRGGLLFDGPFR